MSNEKIKVVVGEKTGWTCSTRRYNYGDICDLLTQKEFEIISAAPDTDIHATQGHGKKLYLVDSAEGKAILALANPIQEKKPVTIGLNNFNKE